MGKHTAQCHTGSKARTGASPIASRTLHHEMPRAFIGYLPRAQQWVKVLGQLRRKTTRSHSMASRGPLSSLVRTLYFQTLRYSSEPRNELLTEKPDGAPGSVGSLAIAGGMPRSPFAGGGRTGGGLAHPVRHGSSEALAGAQGTQGRLGDAWVVFKWEACVIWFSWKKSR